jgi:hypothetical protein
MASIKKQQCIHCHTHFIPDHRNSDRQRFCHLPECRRASKAASQKRWLAKNPDHFKGPDNVFRVQEWRRNNPDWQKDRNSKKELQDGCPQKITQKQNNTATIPPEQTAVLPQLQESCQPESSPKQDDTREIPPAAKVSLSVLQDSWIAQQPVLIGLIAQITGLVLQDDIACATSRLAQLGQDVLNGLTLTPGGPNDSQVPNLSRPHPHHSPKVQLAGSSPDP